MSEATTDFGLPSIAGRDMRRRVAIIVSLILVLAAAGAALFMVRGVDNQLADVGRTYEVRKFAREFILTITEAESGQRGYLLTLDRSYLEPYERAIARIDDTLDTLLQLLATHPAEREQLEALIEPLEKKRAEMATTIQLAATGRVDEALALLRSDAGQSMMTGISDEIRAFIAGEDAKLLDRNAAVERSRQLLVAAILAALAASATLAYALFTRSQRQVSALARTRSALLLQNEELEAHVRSRTAEVEEARAHAERERERVEALLQDTNHRIGNSLATVSSLLGLQVTRTKSAEVRNALEAAQSRVQAIASGHRRLRLGADLETTKADEFLDAVVDDLKSNQLAAGQVTFVSKFEPLIINARDATTIGIVLGELVTNALKHAFPDGRAGHIWTRFTRDGAGVVTLSVEDNGKGMEEHSPGESGLGSMIIKQLALQFGGAPSYRPRAGGGTIVTVTLPGVERSGDGPA